MPRLPPQETSIAPGFLLAKSESAPAEASNPASESGPIHDWLEVVKEGYGDRFAAAFEELGVEDVDDLGELVDGKEAAELLDSTLSAYGAKAVQLQKIRRALAELTGVECSTKEVSVSPPLFLMDEASRGSASGQAALKSSACAPVAPIPTANGRGGSCVDHDLLMSLFTGPRLAVAAPIIPRPGSVSPPSTFGFSSLRTGDGPHLYFVHSIDGDPFRPGETFSFVTHLLGNCNCVALEYNSDAKACNSLVALCALYVRRIFQHAHGSPSACLYLVGNSFGCIIAHEVATQLQALGRRVGLILIGAEVRWPSPNTYRMGGYPWLQGKFEAPLWVARNVGAMDFAETEVLALLDTQVEKRDANRVQMRAYWKHAGPADMPYEDFMHIATTGAENMDILHDFLHKHGPSCIFTGETLFLLPASSPEFECAEAVNSNFCSNLHPVLVQGTAYDLLQVRNANATANVILGWLRQQGERITAMPLVGPAPPLNTPMYPYPNYASPSITQQPVAPQKQIIQRGPSREDVATKVMKILNEQVMEPLELTSNLEEGGLDSISMSLVATQIQNDLGVQLTAGNMIEMVKVNDLVDYIVNALPKKMPVSEVLQRPTNMTNGAVVLAPARLEVPEETDLPGTATLQRGDGPLAYVVHGIDGDIFSPGASYAAVAPLIAPCRTVALVYDEQAYACKTLPQLAAEYTRRIIGDSSRFKNRPIFIVGYSFGCVIAHQMALQVQGRGVKVGLLLVDFEVTYPPAPDIGRLGGYDWLGGAVEATLLLVRSMGGIDGIMWSENETKEMLKLAPSDRDVKAFQDRAFAKISANRRGFRRQEFDTFAEKGGRNMDRMDNMSRPWKPSDSFEGDALLILAPDSGDFHRAADVNRKYCKSLEVAYALGTHYSILQAELAPKAAGCMLTFMRRLGHDVPEAVAVTDVPGISTLSTGSGPRFYMVHGIDGDFLTPGASYASLAPMIAPCNAAVLLYDEEAYKCESIPALARLYNARILQDMMRSLTSPVFIVGYSFGCVIAHQMALQIQQSGQNVGLILLDFEVAYPPEPSLGRLGGYDWLGGEIEAVLLMARSMCGLEGVMWAEEETKQLLAMDPKDRDIKAFQERTFQNISNARKGFRRQEFDTFAYQGGKNMDKMDSIARPWAPQEEFKGETLLVLAPDSKDFHCAADVNRKHCTSMEVAYALGTHYNMLQAAFVPKAVGCIFDFLRKLGHEVPESPTVSDIAGTKTLRFCDGPRAYVVHGSDGRAENFQHFADCLSSFNVVALVYDDDASKCKSVSQLANLYNARVLQDILRNSALHVPIYIGGYDMGCAVAHEMVLQIQQTEQDVSLVLFDHEVAFPPAPCSIRLGGYDWCGGLVEAALQLVRASCGKEGISWSEKEAISFGNLAPTARNDHAFVDRACKRITACTGNLDPEELRVRIEETGLKLERLYNTLSPWTPEEQFKGRTLLITAPQSPEFEAAKNVNSRFCTKLSVSVGSGTHYGLFDVDNAPTIAEAVAQFARTCGHLPEG